MKNPRHFNVPLTTGLYLARYGELLVPFWVSNGRIVATQLYEIHFGSAEFRRSVKKRPVVSSERVVRELGECPLTRALRGLGFEGKRKLLNELVALGIELPRQFIDSFPPVLAQELHVQPYTLLVRAYGLCHSSSV